MKFKNIFASLLCYLILTAFVSCISCEFFLHSSITHPKSQQFSSKQNNVSDQAFLFEEDEDNDEADGFGFIDQPAILANHIQIYKAEFDIINKLSTVPFQCLFKTSLLIRIRNIRI